MQIGGGSVNFVQGYKRGGGGGGAAKIYLGVLTIFLKTLIKVSSDKQPKLFVLKTKCLLHL